MVVTTAPAPHVEAARVQLEWLGLEDGQLIELQTLPVEKGGVAYHAFATCIDGALKLASSLVAKSRFGKDEPIAAQGVYIIVNAHVTGMEAIREQGAWLRNTGGVTTDERIAYRRCFYLDFDTKRVNDLPISSTKDELAATAENARKIREDIETALAAVGIEEPDAVIAKVMSGNGFQFWLRLDDIPETDELRESIKFLLAAWSALFDSDAAHVDKSVCDAKRIAPLAGSYKRKGAHTKERPHRRVIFSGSPTPRALSFEELLAVVDHYKKRLTPEQAAVVAKSMGSKTPSNAGTARTPRIPSTAQETHPYEIVKRLDTLAVLAALGLVKDGHPMCPACGHDEDNSIPDGGGLKCFRATCPDTAPFFSNLGLVARARFGTTDLAGTSVTAKTNRRNAYQWLRQHFPELPELRSNPAAMLDAILASDVSEVSLGNGGQNIVAANDSSDDAFSYTDDGNALAFVKANLGKIVYIEAHDCFYVWSGASWEKDKKEIRTIALMRALGRKMFEAAVTIDDEKQRKRAVEHARRTQSERSIRAAVKLVKTDERIRLDADKLDANADLLAVANGTIDLSCKPPKLRAHSADDYLTKLVPIPYDENATCPEFERAVAATSDDAEVVAFRWRRFASYLDGHPDQYILIAWGLPGTGKSTLHEEIAAVLGPHAAKVPKSIFEVTHHEQHPADLTTLEGKRFCYGAEIRPHLNIDRINELTGDAHVPARGMAENWRNLRRTWKITYYSNKKPVIRADPQNGIWRRTIFDPWTRKVESPKAPDEVKAIFATERTGILARLVRAYADYQEKGLSPPVSVLAATTKFKKEQDTLKPFLDKHCDLSDKAVKTPFKEIWERFEAWAKDFDPNMKISKKRLALDLEARGILGDTLPDRKKTDVRVGIKLLDMHVRDDNTVADGHGMSASAIDEDEIEKLLEEGSKSSTQKENA